MAAHLSSPPIDWTNVSPLERPDWDEWTGALPGWTLFHGRDWATVLAHTYHFKPRYLVGRRQDRIEVMIPLMHISSGLTGNRGVGLPFTDESPPLLRNAGDWAESLEKLALAARSNDQKWRYVELRGTPLGVTEPNPSLKYRGHRLSLGALPANWLKSCSKLHQRAMRKAQAAHLDVETTTDESTLREFYGLFCLTRRKLGAPPQPWRFFQQIHQQMLAKGLGCLVSARRAGRMVASALFLHDQSGQQVTYRFGASAPEALSLFANHLVMGSAIESFRQQGFAALEFGRTTWANEGLHQFKRGWGAETYTIDYHRWSGQDFQKQTVDDLTGGLQTKIFQHLPVRLSRLIGALLYRHIA